MAAGSDYKQLFPYGKGLQSVYTYGEAGKDASSLQIELGTRIFDQAGREYVFKEIEGSSASTGDVVAATDPSADKVDPTGNTQNASTPAGVVVASSTVSTQMACFVQQKGPGKVDLHTDNSVGSNNAVAKSSAVDGSATTDNDGIRIGFVYNTDSSSTLPAGDYKLDL